MAAHRGATRDLVVQRLARLVHVLVPPSGEKSYRSRSRGRTTTVEVNYRITPLRARSAGVRADARVSGGLPLRGGAQQWIARLLSTRHLGPDGSARL